MADRETSQFPKMGEEPLTSHLVNVSGERSPYTMMVPRKGPSTDSETEPATHRRSTVAGETNGPACRPMTTIDYPNAPERLGTGRGMRTVPSAVGNRDFWNDRAASQSGEVIH